MTSLEIGAKMNKILKEITDDTLRTIRTLEIVLPEVYRDIFATMAQNRGIDIESIDTQAALDYALEKIQTISAKTKESASELHIHVEHAQVAVEKKDAKALSSISQDLKILEKKITRLQEEVFRDSLTGLYNRRWLYEEFLKNDAFTCKGVLAFLDLDAFKAINDNYGHQTGDKVLIVLSQVLRKLSSSFLVRFAGDEFIIISTENSTKSLDDALRVIQKNLKETPLKTGKNTFNVSFSYGLSAFDIGDNFEKIYSLADAKMYEAKSTKSHYQDKLKK